MSTTPGFDIVDYAGLTDASVKLILLSRVSTGQNLDSADYLGGQYQFTTTDTLTSLAPNYTVAQTNDGTANDQFFRILPGVSADTSSISPVYLQGTTITLNSQTYGVIGHSDQGILVSHPTGAAQYLLVVTNEETVTLAPGTYNFSLDNPNVPFDLPLRTDTRVEDSVGSYEGLVGTTLTGSTIYFDPPADGKTYTPGINQPDQQSFVVQSVQGGVITAVDGSGTTFKLTVMGHDANGIMAITSDGTQFAHFYLTEGPSGLATGDTISGVSIDGARPFDLPPVCFAEGTMIATPAGLVAVETIAAGDLVLTASGEERAVKWLGSMLCRPARDRRPHQVNPVRIRAGAFGEGLPVRDLRVSPGHAIFVDGVLIPAGLLVNGATIVQEEVEQIRYFHVELDSHDVLLAEGLPCESYLDDGNRSSFANSGEHVALNGRLDPKSWDDACAPMVAAGPQLAAVQEMLGERAEALGWVKSEDADLRLSADGVEIAPLVVRGNRFWFQVPAAASLKLVSNSGVLAHVMPGLSLEGRRLGVAVSELRIDGDALSFDDAAFGNGFHTVEHHDTLAWRWTDGEAELARPVAAQAMVEVALVMVAPSWTRPIADLARIAA